MTSRNSAETERKYDPGPGSGIPELTGIPGVDHEGETSETELEAVYYDTGSLELAARGITLRRRTGGTDPGWHLKIPAGPDSRTEYQSPLGQPGHVPAELLAHLAAITRGRGLSPVAQLSTRRRTHPLHGPGGEHLADFADDLVHAVPFRDLGPESEWREWEIELVHATPKFFSTAKPCLKAAGAARSTHASKLARALNGSWPEAKTIGDRPARKKGPVRDVVVSYAGVQIRELLTRDPGVRSGAPESVHQMRSAARRLRSVLRTYRSLFEKETVTGLGRELQWLGRVLGRPRDAEVIRQRILANLNELAEAEAAGPARSQLEHELDTIYNAGYRNALATLDSHRYYRLLDALERFCDSPPATPKAKRKAGKTSARLVNKAATRLEKSHRAAKKVQGTSGQDTALHQVRKDAKRLRHAAESVTALHGKRARALEKSSHRFQSILGNHQDAVVASELLHRLSTAPDLPAGTLAVYQTLIQHEAETAANTEAAYRKLRKKARDRRL